MFDCVGVMPCVWWWSLNVHLRSRGHAGGGSGLGPERAIDVVLKRSVLGLQARDFVVHLAATRLVEVEVGMERDHFGQVRDLRNQFIVGGTLAQVMSIRSVLQLVVVVVVVMSRQAIRLLPLCRACAWPT